MTLRRLIELTGEGRDATIKALKATNDLCPSQALTRNASDDLLVFLTEDARRASDDLILSFLRRKRQHGECAFVPKDLAKLVSKAAAEFEKGVKARLAQRSLPVGVGAIRYKKSDLLFLLEDAVGAAPASARANGNSHHDGLAERFRRAFDQLDEQSGRSNYVSLHRLRTALPDVTREQFDACLSALRRAQQFTLDPSDGRHQRLTDEEREAGIAEAGSLLVYAARR
jgi:hypothetical protein